MTHHRRKTLSKNHRARVMSQLKIVGRTRAHAVNAMPESDGGRGQPNTLTCTCVTDPSFLNTCTCSSRVPLGSIIAGSTLMLWLDLHERLRLPCRLRMLLQWLCREDIVWTQYTTLWNLGKCNVSINYIVMNDRSINICFDKYQKKIILRYFRMLSFNNVC
ncbi:uncharacterized protein LOC143195732 [Rhynchophorus ferrugineus]|uniref:uncharacterized protein LOC143195732 n=1 Tax=Rhynchophorus ferrugineus TaxID=354439 RepID=UPI003FCCCB23